MVTGYVFAWGLHADSLHLCVMVNCINELQCVEGMFCCKSLSPYFLNFVPFFIRQ